MNKIPTAKQFFDEELSGEPLTEEVVIEALKDFAKLHVKAALKAAAKKAKVIKDLGTDENGDFICEVTQFYYDEEGYPIYVHEKSILNAYLENRIK